MYNWIRDSCDVVILVSFDPEFKRIDVSHYVLYKECRLQQAFFINIARVLFDVPRLCWKYVKDDMIDRKSVPGRNYLHSESLACYISCSNRRFYANLVNAPLDTFLRVHSRLFAAMAVCRLALAYRHLLHRRSFVMWHFSNLLPLLHHMDNRSALTWERNVAAISATAIILYVYRNVILNPLDAYSSSHVVSLHWFGIVVHPVYSTMWYRMLFLECA